MKKNNKLKVETYKIKGWEDTVTGLVISENDDWALVQNIPEDYRLDGYTIYRKKYIKKTWRNEDEKRVEYLLGLQETKVAVPKSFEFGTDVEMLRWIEKTYGVFEFQDYDEEALFYGKINKIIKEKMIIDMVKSDGSIEKKFDWKFSLKKIRAIAFDSDYFKAIVLMMEKGGENA